MAVYGYVRVSTAEQNPARQVGAMEAAGVDRGNVYVDKASGRDMDRPAWAELDSILSHGDVLVLDSLDRLGRDYEDVTRAWRELTRGRGVAVRCLDLDFFDSERFAQMGDVGACVEDMLLSLLSYVAAAELAKMRERQAAGIAIAKKQGKYKGGKPREFDHELLESAKEALDASGPTAAARVLGVHPNTVRNMRKAGRI